MASTVDRRTVEELTARVQGLGIMDSASGGAGAAQAPGVGGAGAVSTGQVSRNAGGETELGSSPALGGGTDVDGQGPNAGEEVGESDERELTASADLEDSSELSASDEDSTWISWFVALRGNEFFCEVDEDYIHDDFNMTGLATTVPYYEYALDMILDAEMPVGQSLTEEQQEVVETAAEMLYGLIHARYILTSRGMQGMFEKFHRGAFGRCPRVYCQGQNVLPVGLSDLPRNCTVAVYCPKCQDIFHPKSTRQANIDGAYFGTTFPHLFLLAHPDLIPSRPSQSYVSRIYGFKINSSSVYHKNNKEGGAASDANSRNSRRRTSKKEKARHTAHTSR
ncbi:unnamed protein product [Discosporangium mesarthrocarpum]